MKAIFLVPSKPHSPLDKVFWCEMFFFPLAKEALVHSKRTYRATFNTLAKATHHTVCFIRPAAALFSIRSQRAADNNRWQVMVGGPGTAAHPSLWPVTVGLGAPRPVLGPCVMDCYSWHGDGWGKLIQQQPDPEDPKAFSELPFYCAHSLKSRIREMYQFAGQFMVSLEMLEMWFQLVSVK